MTHLIKSDEDFACSIDSLESKFIPSGVVLCREYKGEDKKSEKNSGFVVKEETMPRYYVLDMAFFGKEKREHYSFIKESDIVIGNENGSIFYQNGIKYALFRPEDIMARIVGTEEQEKYRW